jgi:hypothetical protein
VAPGAAPPPEGGSAGTLVVMSESTPYDEQRAGYSREALARLVVCDLAVRVADAAAGLVSTRHDVDTGVGGRSSQAAQIVEFARELLSAAMIYEFERGGSWAEAARYLGATAADAEAEFGPFLARWRAAFAEPYVYEESGRKRVPSLPKAAYDPDYVGSQLDQWANGI